MMKKIFEERERQSSSKKDGPRILVIEFTYVNTILSFAYDNF